jgi:hypothetical protein
VTVLADSQRAEAVAAFDSRFGEMERVLWYLSKNCRAALLAGESSPVIESLVWAIKSWWGVMGVRSEAKAQMSSALAVAVDWSPALFDPLPSFEPGAADRAAGWVDELVGRSMEMGVPNRLYSLASKVLHWLLPWQVPAFDQAVRAAVGVPGAWDLPRAYRQVAIRMFAMARVVDPDAAWIGPLEPRSPLRALDKCTWWLGGGNAGKAAVVNDPWRVVRQLGLPLPSSTAGEPAGSAGP